MCLIKTDRAPLLTASVNNSDSDWRHIRLAATEHQSNRHVQRFAVCVRIDFMDRYYNPRRQRLCNWRSGVQLDRKQDTDCLNVHSVTWFCPATKHKLESCSGEKEMGKVFLQPAVKYVRDGPLTLYTCKHTHTQTLNIYGCFFNYGHFWPCEVTKNTIFTL